MTAISSEFRPAIKRRPGRRRKASSITLPSYETPTAEHIRQAVALGLEVVVEDEHTPSGQKTQIRRHRVVSPLEQLRRAGVIDDDQCGAALRYQHTASMAAISGPGSCVQYKPRMIQGGSPRFLLPIEAAADYLTQLAAAQAQCPAIMLNMLHWIAVEPCGWREQACIWWPDISERGRRAEFQRRLRITCNALARHYNRRA